MNSMRNTFPLLSLLWSPVWLLSLALAGGAAHAEPATVRYTVVEIGGPGTDGLAINSLGDIAGVVRDLDMPQAFLHADGALKRLGTLGGGESYGAGVNDKGHVVGMSTTADNHRRAFFYANGAMSDIGTLGGAESTATGINNAGQIVGSAANVDNEWHAFRYASGAMQDLGTLGGTVSGAFGVNRHGHVVGNSSVSEELRALHAFIYDSNGMRDLGTFGGDLSAAWAINDAGHAVGYAATADNAANHAFIYAGGALADLGTLGGNDSFANGINNAGQVVGTSSILGDAASHGFLYSDGGMRDLNSLIDPALGWTIHFAYNINDHGQIAAAGCRAGDCVALRLDPAVAPVPEPPAWAALACGLALLAMSLCMHRAPPVFRIAG